jgi:hypothetical protein
VAVGCNSAYKELFQTGGIQSTAEGEKVILNFQASVCGDILIFIGPKNSIAHSGVDVMELIINDNTLESQKVEALKVLRRKLEGLMALPKMIAGIICLVLSFPILINFNSDSIYALFDGKLSLGEIWSDVYLILLGLVLYFIKSLVFRLISFYFWAKRCFSKS